MAASTKEWVESTVGCAECDSEKNYFPSVKDNKAIGVYSMICATKGKQTLENAICGIGKI